MDGERRVSGPVKRNRYFRPDVSKGYRIAARASSVALLLGALVHGLIVSGQFDDPGSPTAKLPGQISGLFGLAAFDIEVAGLQNHEAAAVLKMIGVKPGGALIGFDAKKAKATLETLDWVQSASVVRRFPNQLHIEITERAPFVVWQYNGELRVVDRNGKPMDSVLASGVNVLLQVVGEGANTAALELVNQMEATPGLFSEVKAAVRLGNRRWNLMMKNGLRIELPEQDMETALKQADADYASGRLQQLPIQSVSYRFDGQVTYKAQSAMVLVPSDPATTSSLR